MADPYEKVGSILGQPITGRLVDAIMDVLAKHGSTVPREQIEEAVRDGVREGFADAINEYVEMDIQNRSADD